MTSGLTSTRQNMINTIQQQKVWDVIVIGGGITGAGILKLAAQLGLKALLVEQKDFAWGSSSRSSKMVHGGLRYLAQGQFKLTQESVQERQLLLASAPQLVKQHSFVMAHYQKQFPWPWLFNLLLSTYDFLVGFNDKTFKKHHAFSKKSLSFLLPFSQQQDCLGASQFFDALTDDARMVLRLIQEARQLGASAINYCQLTNFIHKNNKVSGVEVQLEEYSATLALNSKIVINATGAWSKLLLDKCSSLSYFPALKKEQQKFAIRPLRGSHIIVPNWILPVASVVSILHPQDRRPVQVFPWQNVTVIGTTDVEHTQSLAQEPKISQAEFDYLLAAVKHQFPTISIKPKHIISTYAGVRPVVANNNRLSPSQEKREHTIVEQAGLITVAGGKLTTFALIAREVLTKAASALNITTPIKAVNYFEQLTTLPKQNSELANHIYQQLLGRYGLLTGKFIQESKRQDLSLIAYSGYLWAELSWALKYEQVQHLDDLLLRRTRLGNILPQGANAYMPTIKQYCQKYLQWSDKKWQTELERYQQCWQRYYSLPNDLVS